jgi:hypothetical protein
MIVPDIWLKTNRPTDIWAKCEKTFYVCNLRMFVSKVGTYPIGAPFQALRSRVGLLGPYSQPFILFLCYKWAQ